MVIFRVFLVVNLLFGAFFCKISGCSKVSRYKKFLSVNRTCLNVSLVTFHSFIANKWTSVSVLFLCCSNFANGLDWA